MPNMFSGIGETETSYCCAGECLICRVRVSFLTNHLPSILIHCAEWDREILRVTVVCPHLLTVRIRRESQKTQHLYSNENSASKKKVIAAKEVKSQPQQTFETGGEDVN